MKVFPGQKDDLKERYTMYCNMVLVSCLFLVTCLPVVTIGASVAALYHTVTKTILGGEGYLFKTYMESWKSNMKQGIVLTLFTAFLLALGAGSVYLFGVLVENGQAPNFFLWLRWLSFVPVLLILPWEFIYLSRFTDNVRTIVSHSFTLGIAAFLTTIYADLWIGIIFAAGAFLVLILPLIVAPICKLVAKKTEPVLLEIAKNTENYNPDAWYGERSQK